MMLRVLSIPGRTHENRYFGLLANALEQEDVIPVTPSIRNTITFAYDVLHLNFPTHYITENKAPKAFLFSILLGLYLVLAKVLGRSIVYTVHDVVPFRVVNATLSRPFLRLTHWVSDAFIFLSASSRAAFVGLYPTDVAKPWILIPHGPYPTSFLTDAQRRQQRQDMGAGETEILVGFLGNIKPYKNIGAIAHLPTSLADGRAVRAVVAGPVEAGHRDVVDAVLGQRPAGSVIRIDERLSNTRLDALIQAVDFVLVPYTMGSNSGVAMLVFSNHGRVIGSDLPIFHELAATVRPPWAYTFSEERGSATDLRSTLETAAARPVTAADVNALDSILERDSFRAAARAIKTLCGTLKPQATLRSASQ